MRALYILSAFLAIVASISPAVLADDCTKVKNPKKCTKMAGCEWVKAQKKCVVIATTEPTLFPTHGPTHSHFPTHSPTQYPTHKPTHAPTIKPTQSPTLPATPTFAQFVVAQPYTTGLDINDHIKFIKVLESLGDGITLDISPYPAQGRVRLKAGRTYKLQTGIQVAALVKGC